MLLMAALIAVAGWQGVAVSAAALLACVYYRHVALGEFGGLSGDLAGWFVQVAEVWMLLALCIAQWIAAVL